MKAEDLENSRILEIIFKPAGLMKGSILRDRLFDGVGTFHGADGCRVAMDVSSGYIKEVKKKVENAKLNNVRIIKRDSLATGLENESIDKVLLFGVIPFPLLPLKKLLPEMYRVLKHEGTMQYGCSPRLSIIGCQDQLSAPDYSSI